MDQMKLIKKGTGRAERKKNYYLSYGINFFLFTIEY